MGRSLLLIFTVAFALLVCRPAQAAISALTDLGNGIGSGASTTTVGLMPNSNVAVGSLVFALVDDYANTVAGSVSDTQLNSWKLVVSSVNGAASVITLYECYNCKALTTVDTVTYTVGGIATAGANLTISLAYATGAATATDPQDTANSASGTGTTISVSTGTLAVQNELVIGAAAATNGGITSAPSGWTAIPTIQASFLNFEIGGNKLPGATTASQTFSPPFTGTPIWGAIIAGFKPPAGGGHPSLSLMGVGR